MAGGGGGGDFDVDINLTALLDVLTNLLFFLMIGASSQTAVEVFPGITLPASTAEQTPKGKDIKIVVGTNTITLDQETLNQVMGGEVVGEVTESGRIEALYRKLSVLFEERTRLKQTDADVLLIMCDKKVPYALLKQVMTTAAEAGFAKFRMAVVTK